MIQMGRYGKGRTHCLDCGHFGILRAKGLCVNCYNKKLQKERRDARK